MSLWARRSIYTYTLQCSTGSQTQVPTTAPTWRLHSLHVTTLTTSFYRTMKKCSPYTGCCRACIQSSVPQRVWHSFGSGGGEWRTAGFPLHAPLSVSETHVQGGKNSSIQKVSISSLPCNVNLHVMHTLHVFTQYEWVDLWVRHY